MAERELESDLRKMIEPEAARLWVEQPEGRKFDWQDIMAFSQAISARRLADVVNELARDIIMRPR